MAQNLLCYATIPHIFQTKFKKVKHATPRNKWSVCWSSSSITYLSPLEGYCFRGRRHTNGYELCPSSSRFIFILIWVGVSSKACKDKKIHEARAFNFTYRYVDDVLSINNSRFAEFLPLIYPPELEVKETTDIASSASFLDLYLDLLKSLYSDTKILSKYIPSLQKRL